MHQSFLLSSLLLASGLCAQTAPAPIGPPLPDDVYANRLEVKLAEGTGAILVDGRLRSRSGANLDSVATLFRNARAERLISGTDLATLDRWHVEANRNARPGETIGHLGLWFRLTTDDADDAKTLLTALRREVLIEDAYFEPIPHLPSAPFNGGDIAPPTPLYTSRQNYMDPAPNGVDAGRAHVIVGGRGRDVQITDMEVYWNRPHEDLCKLNDPNVWAGRPSTGSGDHGTAVVGEMVGDRNGYGIRGISDMSGLKISSWNDGGVANAIANGQRASSRGDIVLLEVHYRTSQGFVPAEAFTSNYNVIRTSTARGIHITEAAGNGNVNLDTLAINGQPRGFLDPQSSNFRDSGAIMCGATEGIQRVAAGFSNYGRRITANGWGRNVVTAGYGNLFGNGDTRQEYSRSFSGTSSASPIVTGVVADLVAAVRYQDERELTIQEVRTLLRQNGTTMTSGKNISVRPDLKKLLAAVNLPDDLDIAAEQVPLGGSARITVGGPMGGQAALLVSARLQKTDFGLNRKLHLDPANLAQVAAVSTANGSATVNVPVPNLPALKDVSFYFQSVSVDAARSRLKLSSSGQIWVF